MEESEGTGVNKQYKIKGGWAIETRDRQTVTKFKNNFKTKGGPDLKVFLSKMDFNDVIGKNATTDSIFISELKNKMGDQEYILPSNTNIKDCTSRLILCEEFNMLWGGTNL